MTVSTILSNRLLAPEKDSGIPDYPWSELLEARWEDLRGIDYAGLGIGATGVGLSSLASELGKSFVLNTQINSLVEKGLVREGVRVTKALASSSAVKMALLSGLTGAAKLNRPQAIGLFFLGATLFHGAHRLWTYKVDGMGWQGVAPEVESYLYTLGMFAATGLAGKGAGMALAKAAPWAKTVGALGAEYAAFTLWEGLEGVGRLAVRNNLTAENIKHALTHPFTFKSSAERALFMGALKAAHPVSSGVQRVVNGKNWSAQGAKGAYDHFGQWQQAHPVAVRVATGTVLGLGGAILLGPAGASLAAMPLVFGMVVAPEGGAAPRSTKPGAFLKENVVDTYNGNHSPEFLEDRTVPDWVMDSLLPDIQRRLGLDDPRKLVTKGPVTAEDFGRLRELIEAGDIEGARKLLKAKNFDKLRELFQILGEAGFFALELPGNLSREFLPEGVDPIGLDQKTLVRVYELMASSPNSTRSAGDSTGCNTGIGMVPILLFGNNTQRAKYLPGLLSGKKLGAFALTEPGSGSDAPGGNKTTAVLSPDSSHYVINGEKTFITNGGIADVYIVFANVNNKSTAFVVERGTVGLEIGGEFEKMGLDGTSTVTLAFSDMKVPAENLLLAEGQGTMVALGTLAMGRSKLASALVGSAMQAINWAIPHARERPQGGQSSIANFGQVQGLLADNALATYASQSIVHRLAGETDARVEAAEGNTEYNTMMTMAETMQGTHRALTAKVLVGRDMADLTSMAKLWASEAVLRVAHQASQIFGGSGVIEECRISTLQRDVRVTTIYEGTSEVQRNIIAAELLRKGELVREAAALEKKKVLEDLDGRLEHVEEVLEADHPLLDTVKLAEQAKSLADWAFGTVLANPAIKAMVTEKANPDFYGRGQLINARLANLATSALAIDSAVQRSLRMHQEKTPEAKTVGVEGKLAQAFAYEELGRMREEALGLMNNVHDGHAREVWLSAVSVVDAMTERVALNVDRLKQEIAKHLTEQGSYTL